MDLFSFSLDSLALRRLLEAALVIGATSVVVRAGRWLALRLFEGKERQYVVSKWIGRVFWGLSLFVLAGLWSPSTDDLVTVLTVLGAGLAVALSDVLLSLAAWAHLTVNPPYRRGDRIEMNGTQGDVVDIRPLQTTLLEIGEWVDAHQSTGRLLHVPNAWIYQHGVKNYTEGFGYLWFEESVVVTYDSDWRAARELMLEMAEENLPTQEEDARGDLRQMTSEYLLRFNVLSPFVYVDLVDHGVKLTLRHLTSARGRRGVRHDLTIEVLERFRAHDQIQIAYPTYSVTASPDQPTSLSLDADAQSGESR